MAQADLLKKLFSNFKTDDREGFIKVAHEIIDDERKKNHGILADELQKIIDNGSSYRKKGISVYSATLNVFFNFVAFATYFAAL